ncbi:disease resistance protein RGA2-like [Silene latifolia]|uniref:disease resistance protein RGA2-like n=1 Tax=Silene latifolia TaxID=37657 RepID=UPI003D77FA6F
MLLGDSESRNDVAGNNVSFVSIIGIRGLGKTALAQLVYNDPRIEMTFELRLWVCVSKEFHLENIFGQMLERNGSKIEGLQTDVRKLINGKKYLLVLDDVWSENRDEWDKLKSFLNLGRKGSRIVVTSRSKNVANVLEDDLMYELKGLSEKNSWDLFKKLAFRRGKEPMDSDHPLFDISKEIWKKCANVPLAIRVMGQGEEGILQILKFSYFELSPALKSCFSVCALFPKDYLIEKELLVRLWLVQGCLDQPCRNEEDVGEEYFLNLLHRCFLQDVKEDMYGEIISCDMHDLIHDLAQEVAGKEALMLDCRSSEFDRRHRHLSLSADNSDVKAICSHFRRLRVLDLHNVQFNTLPDKVDNLSHLRYLDLSQNRNLEVLPNSITKLPNLQVLSLDDTRVRELPRDMRRLVNLRHLSFRNCNCLTHMPAGLDNLTCLHTLTKFLLEDGTSYQSEIGKLRDLKALVNLRGELLIRFLWKFSCDVTNYREVELIRVMRLRKLCIYFGCEREIHEILLGSLQPHSKLMEFNMTGYKGARLPTWAESLTTSLPYLVKIQLNGGDRLDVLPSLSQLRHLKSLSLESFLNLELMENDIVVGSSDDGLLFFPSLEGLQLVRFPKLKGWWREEKSRVVPSFPRVSELLLLHCPSLITFPPCPNLINIRCHKALSSFGNETMFPSNPSMNPALYLKKVTIDNVGALDWLFRVTLRAIHNLSIFCFQEERLSIAVEKSAHTIREVSIHRCPNLISLSGFLEHITNLQKLNIVESETLELESDEERATLTQWRSLQALSVLNLSNLP